MCSTQQHIEVLLRHSIFWSLSVHLTRIYQGSRLSSRAEHCSCHFLPESALSCFCQGFMAALEKNLAYFFLYVDKEGDGYLVTVVLC